MKLKQEPELYGAGSWAGGGGLVNAALVGPTRGDWFDLGQFG